MTLRKLLALSFLLLPMIASAHKFETDQRVPPVGIADRGELILDNDKFSYKSWNSAQLPGKVRIVQHIAGRTSAKEKNATRSRQSKPPTCRTTNTRPPLSSTQMTPSPAPVCLCAAVWRAIRSSTRGRNSLSTAMALRVKPGNWMKRAPLSSYSIRTDACSGQKMAH